MLEPQKRTSYNRNWYVAFINKHPIYWILPAFWGLGYFFNKSLATRLSNACVSTATPHFWSLVNRKLKSESNKQLHLNFIFHMSSSVEFGKAETDTRTTAKYIGFLCGRQEGPTFEQLYPRGWAIPLRNDSLKTEHEAIFCNSSYQKAHENPDTNQNPAQIHSWPESLFIHHRVVRSEKENPSSLVSYWCVAHLAVRELL